MQVNFKGSPLNLEGEQVQAGQQAPDFKVVNSSMEEVGLPQLPPGVVVLNVVPSLDTPVCKKQSKQFYASLKEHSVNLVTVSMDLPFAQSRFCEAEEVEMHTLSDYKYGSFGQAYGLMISELRLLTRSVLILDESRRINYVQIVPEVTDEPNYEEVIGSLKQISGAAA
jgi:thiol peroxidase